MGAVLVNKHMKNRMGGGATLLFLLASKQEDVGLITWIIIGDETYVHYYTPMSKQQSMAQCGLGEPKSKKIKMTPSTGKIMTTIFWDQKDISLLEYHPASINTTQDSWADAETIKSRYTRLCFETIYFLT